MFEVKLQWKNKIKWMNTKLMIKKLIQLPWMVASLNFKFDDTSCGGEVRAKEKTKLASKNQKIKNCISPWFEKNSSFQSLWIKKSKIVFSIS